MQKLKERYTYTPKNITHVLGNCDHVLNIPEGRESVHDSKTSFNNPYASFTPREQGGKNLRVSSVYVLNMRGKPLMPCSPQKARKLLNQGDAYVTKRTPFVIKLNKQTGESKQKVTLGIDSGYQNIGFSALSEKKELYSSEVKLRKDIVNLNSERRMYRRTRRNRKTWYRKPRFLNRKKSEGWLAPSIQHKLDSHVKITQKISNMIPIESIIVEVASFDIQKIKNPDIQGKEYQEGEQLGFSNVKEYVLHRDNHICQCCKGKSKDKILIVHHKVSRKTGGERPENLITLCETCHLKYHNKEIDFKVKISKEFKAESFMNIVRQKLVDKLKELFNNVSITYGYITKQKRKELSLNKSHSNDAFVIANGCSQIRNREYFIKQVRKCNRKLFRGIRSHIKNTAPRLIKGFQRYDKVLWKNVECFIFGRRKTGYFDIRKLCGNKIHSSAKVSDLKLLESFGTLLTV